MALAADRKTEALPSAVRPPSPHGGWKGFGLSVCRQGHSTQRRQLMAATKAQEIYEEVEKRIASGVEKAKAFKQLAAEKGRPYDSVRGSYYSHKKKLEGGESKPRT